MRHILFLSVAVFWGCFCSIGCTRNDAVVDERLKRAEKIVDSLPAEALSLLDSIEKPERLSRADYALYCLVRTEAQDKSGCPARSEKQIAVAADYFGTRSDYERAARSYFYQSRVLSDISDDERRLRILLQAEEYMPLCSDENLKGLICYDIGEVYKSQYFWDEAIAYYEKALSYFRKMGKIKNEVRALYRIGWTKMDQKDFHEAVSDFEKCLNFSKNIEDEDFIQMVYTSLGTVNYWLKNYAEAKCCLFKSIALNNSSFLSGQYAALGDIYREEKELDSAKLYYNKTLYILEQQKDTIRINGILLNLYRIEKLRGNHKEALCIYEQYHELSNLVHKQQMNNSMLKIRHLYDNEKLQVEKQKLSIRNRNLCLVIAFMLLVAITTGFVHRFRMAAKERRILQKDKELLENANKMKEQVALLDQQRIRMQETELENQRIRLDKQALEMKMQDLALRKKTVCALLLAKVKLAQKINSTLKLWSDQRSTNVRFTMAAKKMFDDYIFDKNSWDEIRAISSYVITDRFYEKLANEKKLPQDDVKLCCMIVVGLKTAEISKILDILPNSVSRKRTRLRQKLEDSPELSLKDLLESWL